MNMGTISVRVPNELKAELEESWLDVGEVVREALVSKLIEQKFSKSKALRRVIFESLISKSKLTKKGAKELADKVNEGMWKEIQKTYPGL